MSYSKRAFRKYLFTVAALLKLLDASQSSAQVKDINITGIRTYADGNLHLFFNEAVSTACGQVIRVFGAGKEDVRSVALAAILSGQPVTVEVEPRKSGNFL